MRILILLQVPIDNQTKNATDKVINFDEWTISPYSPRSTDVFSIYKNGNVRALYAGASLALVVRPTVYLKSNAAIGSGEGTSSNPYQIELS